ncbi:hypothetical protein D3C74_482120 [compost metagenome]
MKSAVPDLAMVPRFSITSSRLMPIPLSAMVNVRCSLSKERRTRSSPSPSYSSGVDSARKRSLSAASEALEISSRRKISLLEYSE